MTFSRSYRFADTTYEFLKSIGSLLLSPAKVFTISIELDVVSADVSTILGWDVLDSHSLTADTVSNGLVKKSIVTCSDGEFFQLMNEAYR